MSRRDRRDWDSIDNDFSGERELPDEGDRHVTEEPAIVPCPYCGKMIRDDAERCHRCGNFILDEQTFRHSPWIYLTAVLLLALIALTFTRLMR